MNFKTIYFINSVLFMLINNTVMAQPPYQYTPAQLRQLLPQPVLNDHPEWISLYWKAWEVASTHIQKGTSSNGFVDYYIDEGFNASIFQWDTQFMLMFYRYGFKYFPTIISNNNFYLKQHSNGYICREINESDGTDYHSENSDQSINPPLFSWAEWEHFLLTSDTTRLRYCLPYLIKYYDYLNIKRITTDSLYWNSDYGSGMDDTPRYGKNWICMSAQMALNALCISRIAEVTGDNSAYVKYSAEHKALANRINAKMWSSSDGFYYDTDGPLKFNKVKTPASFWPLVANIADSMQCKALITHITNSQEFWRTHLIPSLSADDPKYNKENGSYWKGAVWAPLNYESIKGLEEYGYDSLATVICENHINNMSLAFKKQGTIFENYKPDFLGEGQGVKDFVGWSGCGPISLLIENILGLRINGPEKKIVWNINRTEMHGLNNLRIDSNIVSLVCQQRDNLMQQPVITITTLKELLLTVKWNHLQASRTFTSGTHTWNVSVTAVRPQKLIRDLPHIVTIKGPDIVVNVKNNKIKQVELLNSKGCIVAKWGNIMAGLNHFNAGKVAQGIYILRFTDTNISKEMKIVIK